MTDHKFEPRDLPKFAVLTVISHVTGRIVVNTITDHTNADSDDLAVKLGAGAITMMTVGLIKPYSDKLVDKTTDFLIAKYRARKVKKTAKKED